MKKTRKSKRLAEKNYRAFKELLKIIRHYFPNFNKLLSSVSDPRHKSYITYTQEEILFFRILSYCCHFKSMREITRELNNDHVIQTSRLLFGDELEEVPHGDTINSYLEEVSIDQLRHILREMLRELMKKKFFDGFKINNRYYHMIIDGVETFSFKNKKNRGQYKERTCRWSKILYDDAGSCH